MFDGRCGSSVARCAVVCMADNVPIATQLGLCKEVERLGHFDSTVIIRNTC